jgi:hypothetical protein
MKSELTSIFKTVLLLNQNTGMNYLIHVLRGNEQFGLKKDAHKKLETFGALHYMKSDKIQKLMSWLLSNGYLTLTNMQYGTLGLTEKAHAVLENPTPFYIYQKELYITTEDRILQSSLKELRKSLSTLENKPVYEIFNNYCIEMILQTKPKTISELKEIAGMSNIIADRYGILILKSIGYAEKEAKKVLHEKVINSTQTPAAQTIKQQFLSGMSIEAIAESRKNTIGYITKVLSDLHTVGEIDLSRYVETQVNPAELHKAQVFFTQTQEGSLKNAYETLGLDYNTLRLCKLYVSSLHHKSEEIAVA